MVVEYPMSKTAFQDICRLNSCLLWLIVVAFCSINQSFGQDWTVRLDDGSIAKGKLTPAILDNTIAIQIAGFTSSFQLNASAVVSISRQDTKTATEADRQEGTLHFELANGLCFMGKLTSVDAEKLTIESPALGEIQIDRSRLRSISTNHNLGKRLYDGPSTHDRWISGESIKSAVPVDAIKLAALDGGVTVATNLELPEPSHIVLELAWKGTPNFAIVMSEE